MPRTLIRGSQEQDIDFVSEAELNDFFDKVVITGTVGDNDIQDTAILETFDDYLPGRGLFGGEDGNTVTTGTQAVTISGFRAEFVSASGFLQGGTDSHDHDDRYYTQTLLRSTASGSAGAGRIGFPTVSGFSTDLTSTEASPSVQGAITFFSSAGWVDGGEISDLGDETVLIASGIGAIRTQDNSLANLVAFGWLSASGIAIANNSTRFIGVSYDSSQDIVNILNKASNTWDYNTEFPLGLVANRENQLTIVSIPHTVGDSPSIINRRFEEVEGPQRADALGGMILGESADNNRNVTVSAGTLWFKLNRFTTPAIDTSGSDTFDAFYEDGGGGFTKVADETIWDNDSYDDGSGVLATLTNNRFGNLWFYMEVSGELSCVYGRVNAVKLSDAELESIPDTLPPGLANSILLGRIIFLKDATIATEVQTAFENTFSLSGASDHGNLAGLLDDDHTQYALLAGRAGDQLLHGGTAATEELQLRGSSDADLGFIRIQSPIVVDSIFDAPSGNFFTFAPTETFTSPFLAETIFTVAPIYTVSDAIGIYNAFLGGGTFTTTVEPHVIFSQWTLFGSNPVFDSNSASIRAMPSIVFSAGQTYLNDGLGPTWLGATESIGFEFGPIMNAVTGFDEAGVDELTAFQCVPRWNLAGADTTANFGDIRGLRCKNPEVALFGSSAGGREYNNYYGLHYENMSIAPTTGDGRNIAVLSDLVAGSKNLFLRNAGGARSELEGVMAFITGMPKGEIKIEQDNIGITFGIDDDVELYWSSDGKMRFDPLAGNPFDIELLGTQTILGKSTSGLFAGQIDFSHIGLGNFLPSTFAPALVTIAKQDTNMPPGLVWSELSIIAGSDDLDIIGETNTQVNTVLLEPTNIVLSGGSIDDMTQEHIEGMGTDGTRNQGLWSENARVRIDGMFNFAEVTPAQITSDQDDYVIQTTASGRMIQRLSTDATRTLTGITVEQTKDALWIVNAGSNDLILDHENVTSSGTNRIISPTASGLTLGPDDAAQLWHDPVDDRWRILSTTPIFHPSVFDAYNTVATNISAGFTDIPLDVQRVADSSYTHVAGSGVVTINQDGLYDVTYTVSNDVTSGSTRSISQSRLSLDNGGGFSPVLGSDSFGYNRTAAGGESSSTRNILLSMDSGDQIKIEASRIAGTSTILTISGGSGLTMKLVR